MSGISVVGNHSFVLGFRLAGIRDTYVEDEKDKLEARLLALVVAKETSIVVMQDTDYNALSPVMRKKLTDSVEPVVISVGSLDEENIREKIKKAVGIDLYNKEK